MTKDSSISLGFFYEIVVQIYPNNMKDWTMNMFQYVNFFQKSDNLSFIIQPHQFGFKVRLENGWISKQMI